MDSAADAADAPAATGADAAGDDASAKPTGAEAVISFTTKLPEPYVVPEDELVVPGTLMRYGLSEVVNRLLSLDKPVPFDFVVNGEYLRTSVFAYLESHRLSSEKVITLEYVLALSEPEQDQVDEVPDWIAAVTPVQAFPSQCYVAVACDGTARLYSGSQSRLVVRLTDNVLTSVAALPTNGGKGCQVVAGCKDGSLRCCAIQHGGDGSSAVAGPVASLSAPGCQQGVQAVALKEDGSLIASGGWDLDIHLWNTESSLFAKPDAAGAGAKRAAAGGAGAVPKFSLQGHSQVVTGLDFGAPSRFPFTLVSCSWDSSVRVWDIAAACCVCNWTVARAVTSVSMSPIMPPQLATSHEDGHVSLWDIRAPPHPTKQGAVSLDATAGLPLMSAQAPHRRLVSKVAWCPEDAMRLASVSHDGHLCILDPRSPKMPLQSLRLGKTGPDPTKLLCATWLARDALAVGGSDGKVVRVSLNSGKLPTGEES